MNFDFRIVVAAGSIVLMLASVPALTRHSANVTPAMPAAEAVAQIDAVVEPAPARAPQTEKIASDVAPRRETVAAATTSPAQPPVATIAPRPAQPPVSAARLVSVPLPKTRPTGAAQIAAANLPTAIVHAPIPKARPQIIATLAPAPAVKAAIKPLVQTPLPKARPQALARVAAPAVVPAAPSSPAPAAAVVTELPSSKDQEKEGVAEQNAPVSEATAETKTETASEATAVSNGELATATANSDPMTIPAIVPVAPVVAEFRPPMPRVRPANIDRLVLVAEMRKYMGTNPTNRRALWCAAFMNMVLNKLGYKGTQSDAARSFVDYGRKIPGPKVGAIAVLTRGPNGGHVGVVSGVDKHGNPILVSGNHGHRVGVGTYPRSRVLAYVLPTPREFKRAAARFTDHTRSSQLKSQPHTSQATTTQLAARSTPSQGEGDALPITELLAAIAAEQTEGRPGSASLRSRASHGKPITELLTKFLSRTKS
jgi:uncharacterized protein (TIGR02594 family)